FFREPLALIFAFAFPFFMLLVLAGVFGNDPTADNPEDAEAWRGGGFAAGGAWRAGSGGGSDGRGRCHRHCYRGGAYLWGRDAGELAARDCRRAAWPCDVRCDRGLPRGAPADGTRGA